LRHKRCVSSLEDMGPGTQFRRVIGEPDEEINNNAENVKVRLFHHRCCSAVVRTDTNSYTFLC
jgi:2-oxoglutarate dehydrogenase complex dehydrogenase (E1) component-like enzyme